MFENSLIYPPLFRPPFFGRTWVSPG